MTPDNADDRLVWLLKTSRNLFATRDVERFIPMATDAFIELTGADRGYLFLTERDTGKISPCAARGPGGLQLTAPDSRIVGLVHQVFKECRPIVATDTEAPESGPRRLSELRLKLLVCMPLVVKQEALGVLYADSSARETPRGQTRYIEIFADHVAAALDNARLFEQASNDLLTGLPNNSFFLAELAKVMRDAGEGNAGGVLLLDLDAFKRINQAAGAEMGDKALQDIAHTLREVLRTDGLVARYGSDKFAILLAPERGTAIHLRLRDVAERARAAIGTKAYYGVQLSASIGGLAFPKTAGESAPDVVAAADDILAKARARGPGQVEIA